MTNNGSLKPLSGRLLSLVRRFGTRVLIHFLAITFAASLPTPTLQDLGFGLYAALICLAGRFLFKPYGGLVPLIAGLATFFAWIALGGYADMGLLLGGIQAWLQSVISGKMIFRAYPSNNWALGEGVAFTLLAVSLIGVAMEMKGMPDNPFFGAIGLELILFVLSLVTLWPFALMRAKRNIRNIVGRLDEAASSKESVPAMIRGQLCVLTDYARTWLTLPLIGIANDAFPFARKLEPVGEWVDHLADLTDGADKLLGTERFYTDLKDLNAHLNRTRPMPVQQTNRTVDRRPPVATFNENEFRLKIASIEAARETAPLPHQAPLAGICRSAENIMEAMRVDPGDVAEGQRFLSRYLKSTLDLLDMQKFFANAPASDEATTAAEARALLLLKRLETAFASEHALLLKNDHLTYVADLNALDRLLDMEAGANK